MLHGVLPTGMATGALSVGTGCVVSGTMWGVACTPPPCMDWGENRGASPSAAGADIPTLALWCKEGSWGWYTLPSRCPTSPALWHGHARPCACALPGKPQSPGERGRRDGAVGAASHWAGSGSGAGRRGTRLCLAFCEDFFCRVLNPQQWARPRVAASRMCARKTRSYSPPQL